MSTLRYDAYGDLQIGHHYFLWKILVMPQPVFQRHNFTLLVGGIALRLA